jgi:hypothetical protein
LLITYFSVPIFTYGTAGDEKDILVSAFDKHWFNTMSIQYSMRSYIKQYINNQMVNRNNRRTIILKLKKRSTFSYIIAWLYQHHRRYCNPWKSSEILLFKYFILNLGHIIAYRKTKELLFHLIYFWSKSNWRTQYYDIPKLILSLVIKKRSTINRSYIPDCLLVLINSRRHSVCLVRQTWLFSFP